MHRESKYIEYKKSRKGLSNDIWSTYSAFANTEGGTIYLGIEEKDRGQKKSLFPVGVEDPEKMIEDFGMHYMEEVKLVKIFYQIKMLKLLILKIKRALKFMYQKRLIRRNRYM